jgi:hypothetical protein
LGKRRGEEKKPCGQGGWIFVHPQNSFNGLILNWCIGGYWFTPALSPYSPTVFLFFLMSFSFSYSLFIKWIDLGFALVFFFLLGHFFFPSSH